MADLRSLAGQAETEAREQLMRWHEWLVISIFGPLVWGAFVVMIDAFSRLYSVERAILAGTAVIWLLCIAILIVRTVNAIIIRGEIQAEIFEDVRRRGD